MFWIIVPYQMCIKNLFFLSVWPFIFFTMFFSAEVLNFNEIAYHFFFLDCAFGVVSKIITILPNFI